MGEIMAKKGTIRTTVKLDGGPEFNKSVKEIDSSLRELRAEMKENNEQFRNSQNSFDALSKKSEILSKQYEESSRKVELYAERLDFLRTKRDEENSKIDENNHKLQEAQSKLSELEITMGKSSDAYIKQAEAVNNLKDEIDKSQQAVEYYDQQELRLEATLHNTTAEQIRFERELNETNGYLKEAETSADKTASSIDEFGNKTDKASENTEKLAEKLESLAHNEAMQRIGEDAKEVLNTLMECAEVAENFEYAMAKVNSIARVSDDTLAGMSEEIRRVGAEMGYSANEVAEATYQAISASVDASEAIGFVEDAAKLARAGFTETTTAVDVLTTALNAYGLESEATAHIADDLITTQNLGKTTVDQLAQSIGTIIPTAAAYNVSLDQLSASYSILTRNGVNTAYATTYLRGMLNELADSGSDVAEILFNETGYSFGELMKQGYSLGDIMDILGNTVDGNTESFANLFGNIRAGQGALNIFNAGADEFNRVLGIMEDNAGVVDEAFEVMADTAVMTNEKFEASIENLKIAIGESLSPALQDIKEIAIDILEPVTEFIEEHPKLVTAIAGIATGLTTATVVATTAAAAIALLRAAIGDLTIVVDILAAGSIFGLMAGLSATIDNTTKSVINLNDELKKNYQATIDTAESSATNISRAKELSERYSELAGKAHLSDSEFTELNGIITELNTTIPGCSIAYRESADAIDENTDSLQINTEQVKANIDALIEEAEHQYVVEELTELYKEQHEAEKQLTEIAEQLEQAETDLAEIEETNIAGHKRCEKNIRDLSEAYLDAEEIYDNTTEKINELSQQTAEYNTVQQEEIESARAAEEAEKAKADALEDAAKRSTDAIESQIGLFDEWNEKAQTTFSEMQDIWEGQNKGLDTYKEDLLYAKGIMEGDFDPAIKNLTASMVELDDAATLHEFIEGLDQARTSGEGLEELTQLWQNHMDKVKEAEGVYNDIILAEQGYYDESGDSQATYFDEKNTAQDEQYQKERDDANTQKDNLVQITTDTVTEMGNAITTTTETAVKPAVTKMCTTVDTEARSRLLGGDNPQAGIGYKLGKELMEAIAKGISENEGVVATALNTAVQNAVNSVDVSGLASKLNAALGVALGG